MTSTDVPDELLDHVLGSAVGNVAAGGGPFAALVLRAGSILAEGVNRVTLDLDPTAHAEVVAIRRACLAMGDHVLAGCVLVSSCEPCPLCLAAALWARVDEVIYVADRDDAAAAGFDDRAFYELFGRPRESWPIPIVQRRVHRPTAPFEAWRGKTDRVNY